jgi:replicative DNA helicase
MGKSLFAQQWAIEASKTRKVLLYSLEMSSLALARRAACNLGALSPEILTNRDTRLQNPEFAYDRLGYAMRTLRQEHVLMIQPTRRLTPDTIVRENRRLCRAQQLDLIMVDYLQLMQSDMKTRDAYERISQISMGLKDAAMTLGVPIIVLSQLNRQCESRPCTRPLMSDLKESGAIEQDADQIVLLWRPAYYGQHQIDQASRIKLNPPVLEDEQLPGLLDVHIAKQRNGKTGSCWLYCDLAQSRAGDFRY